ncbi:hypothetical protein J5N97_024910 [Dioscorea zingiberensis]|uniref:Uncharacterized protein n=1 Tax=Dioscorea zingiberensis TaxID=325984 RepID=A0A9D5C842_9LILI|nr:hypothetical protein J5N97_024910 [Dioscorea zingiberensis]
MPRKEIAKRRRDDAGPSLRPPCFAHEQHQQRYARLTGLPLSRTFLLDWDPLEQLHIADRVRSLLSVNGWDRVFAINEATYREHTLEVLSSFEFDRSPSALLTTRTISFQLYGVAHRMSLDRFAIYMGIYDQDYLRIPGTRLLTSFPGHIISHSRYWQQLGGGPNKKASSMTDPVHRYIHALVSRTIAGRTDSTGVVTVSDRFLLYSIFERTPIHLGYVLADYIAHQGQSHKHKHIIAGPYITRLIRGMPVELRTDGIEHLHLMQPLGMNTLLQMKLVQLSGGRYRLAGRLTSRRHLRRRLLRVFLRHPGRASLSIHAQPSHSH